MSATDDQILEHLVAIRKSLTALQQDVTEIRKKMHELGSDVPLGRTPATEDTR